LTITNSGFGLDADARPKMFAPVTEARILKY
jgi:hypothetical protein